MKSDDDDIHFDCLLRCLESEFDDVVEEIVEVIVDEEIFSLAWIVSDYCNYCILTSASLSLYSAAAVVDISRRAVNCKLATTTV